jgi:hypothetical protein
MASKGGRSEGGNMGGGPRVQTESCPKDGPLGQSVKDTSIVEPVILKGGKARGPDEG